MRPEAVAAAGDRVTTAIRSASRTTGATFDYLLRTAIRESSLDPAAAAKTSSARGLYQFIESTWLATVKEEGPKYGLGSYAASIQVGSDGQYFVRDPAVRAQILKLRENPEVSSVMAGALAKRNAEELSRTLGRKPTPGEVYLAHFLGASGAKKLIALKRNNPGASAVAAFPEAARANRSIFYESNGKARSASDVLAALTQQHNGTPVVPTPPTTAFAELRPILNSDPFAKLNSAKMPKVVFQHPINPARSAFAAEEGPAFQALFRDGVSHGALSPAVRELWSNGQRLPRQLASVAPDTALSAPGLGAPLNLLDHMKPSVQQSVRRSKI
jgi:hypothetical protein